MKMKIVILDEIQLRLDLFPVLRYLIDKKQKTRKILDTRIILPELPRQSSETLAGRISYCSVSPFLIEEQHKQPSMEISIGDFKEVAFPDSFLAETDPVSFRWRENYA